MSNAPSTTDALIRIDCLTRRFGSKAALDGVNLSVPRGSVFGLVGENGAGKTTLIKHILGLLRAEAGSVRVFNLDPVRDCVGVLSQIGYLSEENDLPGWMRVHEYLAYMRAFYPKWDDAYALELQKAFDLDTSGKLRNLSKGQKARLSLVAALAHRPELLVLDEPSSGLDPIVRRDILSAIIRTIADQGRTVLFSSHLLDEVERVSDYVTMLHRGHVLFSAGLDDIKETHHRLTLHFETDLATAPQLAGTLTCVGRGREWTALCSGRMVELESAANRLGARIVDKHVPSLDEIFVAQVGTHRTAF